MTSAETKLQETYRKIQEKEQEFHRLQTCTGELDKLHLEHLQQRSRQVYILNDSITTSWQQLVYHAEERFKLIKHSIEWYSTFDSVMNVLDRVLRDYKRPDDWCRENVFTASGARAQLGLSCFGGVLGGMGGGGGGVGVGGVLGVFGGGPSPSPQSIGSTSGISSGIGSITSSSNSLNALEDRIHLALNVINRHVEQKEAFLKVL